MTDPDEQAEFAAAQAEVRALIRALDPDDDAQRRHVAAAAKEVITRLPWNAQQAQLIIEFLDAYHRYAPAETPALTDRLCACGCGWPVFKPWPEEYASDACRRNLHERADAAAREFRESEPPEHGRAWLHVGPAAGEAGIGAVPGRVLGSDIEGQADALEEAAARLVELLAVFTKEPRRSMDVIAVFRGLSRSASSMADAAAELRRQEWFDLDDPEASATWNSALDGLRSASRTFGWIADGWI